MTNIESSIINLLRSTQRPGIDNLIREMEDGGYFTAPCSGGNHLAKEGGLARHSINVYELACGIASGLPYNFNDSKLIIITLLHDLGKMGDHGKPNYVPNMVQDGRPTKTNPEQKYKQSESKPYAVNGELLYIPHEARSIMIARQHIELTEDEEFAIYYHNGLYAKSGYDLNGRETPLQMLLHFADMWASRVVEVQ